mgnify:CR=1 FL=1
MVKKIEKQFGSYRDQLIHLAKLYNIVEVKSYAKSAKRLTVAQLELLLIKNHIKLPVNRSSDKAIAKQELHENSIRNVYLSLFIIFFIGCLISVRPYIKNVVNEVKFTYVAEEFKSEKIDKLKKKKKLKKKTAKKKESDIERYDNSVSLNAETAANLFEDLNYDLKSVRAGQKVKPIYLTKLPKDLNSLGSTKKKRELFIKIVLPLILAENNKITEDRKKLFKILGKSFNTVGERVWLKRRFKEYKIDDKDLSKLKMRMDIIPVSIALAQAANESGWGTSRFAREFNALFGEYTYSYSDGVVPLLREKGEKHLVKIFESVDKSVQSYFNNLNSHNAYDDFREVRQMMREKNNFSNIKLLVDKLDSYAADINYVKTINSIIDVNKLDQFDAFNYSINNS